MEMEIVEEEHPLKQGLKLDNIVVSMIFYYVEEEHPLKQGLKQIKLHLVKWFLFS